MPPYLSMPYFQLSKLPLTTKVALTGFYLALLTAIAFATFGVFAERTHWKSSEVQANWAGDERARAAGATLDEKRMVAEPSRRSIYDIVHPHSFMMPLIYFVLVHLMEMSIAPRGFKIGLYIAGFVAMMLTILAPVLVWSNLSMATIVPPVVALWMGSSAIMIAVPAWQMWQKPPAQ